MNKELIKQAFQLGYIAALEKQGSPISDSIATAVNPYAILTPRIDSIGAVTGLLSNPATDKDIEEYDEHPGRAWFAPGVAKHRRTRAFRRALTDSSGNSRHLISQSLGLGTSSVLGGLGGAALGGLIGHSTGKGRYSKRTNTSKGALIGAAAGAGLPILVSALAAAFRKRRNQEEHDKYLESSTVPEYLVPGLSTYNRFKTIGYEQGKYNERKARRKADRNSSKTDDRKPDVDKK